MGRLSVQGLGRQNQFKGRYVNLFGECDIMLSAATLDSGENSESFVRIDGCFYKTQIAENEKGDIWAGLYIGDRGNGLEA